MSNISQDAHQFIVDERKITFMHLFVSVHGFSLNALDDLAILLLVLFVTLNDSILLGI